MITKVNRSENVRLFFTEATGTVVTKPVPACSAQATQALLERTKGFTGISQESKLHLLKGSHYCLEICLSECNTPGGEESRRIDRGKRCLHLLKRTEPNSTSFFSFSCCYPLNRSVNISSGRSRVVPWSSVSS